MVELTLRCTNGADAEDATPHVDVEFKLLTEAPYWKDEETDDDPAVGGYRRNGIAMRRTYELAQLPFGISALSLDMVYTQADYELRAALLRARRLYIVDVRFSGDEHMRKTTAGAAFWPLDDTDPENPIPAFEPIEVRKTANTVSDNRTNARWTLALEDCLPTVGVTIA